MCLSCSNTNRIIKINEISQIKKQILPESNDELVHYFEAYL
jgi:hypothetical protein